MYSCKYDTKPLLLVIIFLSCFNNVFATNYTVSDKAALQTRMAAALPGDTIIVSNGTYNNWGNIVFTNNNGTNTSAWIVLKAQSFNGVVFTGITTLQFAGRRLLITGFKFSNGSSGGTTDVIQFRSSSSLLANYCRLTNITIENFSSDSTGSVAGIAPDIDNKWVSLYGTNNRVDHCTFNNKVNAGATITVWYDNTTYPNQSTTTLHKIDSNYFKGRGYQGSNGGETIRVGTSSTSRTNGYNVVEYNLFEDCIQVEPEIISNKSNFNTYRYNTFKNCNGGVTMRHGRYCTVHSNFFILEDATKTRSYGVRLIDKGHKVFNNYFEGLLGNRNSLTALRCPIILYNGLSSTNDTIDASKASGYFPADSSMIAFNTIVNCSGGGGIVLGFTDGGSNTFQPKGIVVANNLIKMTTGQAAFNDATNTQLTYAAEGNMFNAPNGVGLSSSTGFANYSLTFGARINGVLQPPTLVQDVAINTSNYTSLLSGIDAHSQTRSSVYDVGCDEVNGTGSILTYPLDSNLVGAGKPFITLPVHLIQFGILLVNKTVQLTWDVTNEINFREYLVEHSTNGINFMGISTIASKNNHGASSYTFSHNNLTLGNNFYRLKMMDRDGSYQYSPIKMVNFSNEVSIHIYPNPASHFLYVEVSGMLLTGAALQIINSLGVTVKTIAITANKQSIPLHQFPKGIYQIRFVQANQVLKQHSTIIQ
jgi:poly(beta-D-mannuronate) lyase